MCVGKGIIKIKLIVSKQDHRLRLGNQLPHHQLDISLFLLTCLINFVRKCVEEQQLLHILGRLGRHIPCWFVPFSMAIIIIIILMISSFVERGVDVVGRRRRQFD